MSEAGDASDDAPITDEQIAACKRVAKTDTRAAKWAKKVLIYYDEEVPSS